MAVIPKRLVAGSQLTTVAATYYTATNVITRIDACAITNTTAGAITATVHLVPSGGTATALNCVLSAQSIAAGGTLIVAGAIGQWVASGGTLRRSPRPIRALPLSPAALNTAKVDQSYSPDVEIDHAGRIVWAREVRRGETIVIPFHMWGQLSRQTRGKQVSGPA